MDFSGIDFRSVDLHGSQFVENRPDNIIADLLDLRDANLTNADLTGANFGGEAGVTLERANLSRVILTEANLGGVWFGATVLGSLDLSEAKGLDKAKHRGPSTLGVDTLAKSRGDIPETFLRGCGLSDWEIEMTQLYRSGLNSAQATDIAYRLVRLHATHPIDFYSCFISYSSKDQDFANRLHADLQNNGVRCWFAPEDLKIGNPFRQRIDESIRLHDKLLLILSEHSVNSQWVQDEVESALERERRENRLVLFPIRIEDSVMETGQAWAKAIWLKHHIGDLTRWKDHDAYEQAFKRLLRDLKAEGKDGGSGK